MISFYDWAPAQQGRGGPEVQEDSVAQQDQELQQSICKKIQDAVDISDVFNKAQTWLVKAHMRFARWPSMQGRAAERPWSMPCIA